MYLYNGIPMVSLNQNIIVTLSWGSAGVTSHGSSASILAIAQTTLAGTKIRKKIFFLIGFDRTITKSYFIHVKQDYF